MYVVVGNCPRCGAPIYAPATWGGILPPPSYHSCGCFPKNTTIIGHGTHPTTFAQPKWDYKMPDFNGAVTRNESEAKNAESETAD